MASHALAEVAAGRARRFGLITTNSIGQSFNRAVVDPHLDGERPFSVVWAVPDHPWVDSADGAAVRVAMTVGAGFKTKGLLLKVETERDADDGSAELTFSRLLGEIHASIDVGSNVASALPLAANEGIAYWGVKFYGDGFIVTPEEAEALREPSGAFLARRFVSGRDLTGAPRGLLALDCDGFDEAQVAASYPRTFQWLLDRVRPVRAQNPRALKRDRWWIFGENQPGMRRAVKGLPRYIATTETAKHRVFQFLVEKTLSEGTVTVISLNDAFCLGVLSSRSHVVWSLAAGGTLEDRPRYNKTVCFDPFPFPNPSMKVVEPIRELGEQLDAHRKARQAEHAGLTITGMYNVLEKLRSGETLTAKERMIHEQGLVSVLKQIHDDLDAAVFEAYGWPPTLTDEEILERLVALNHERAEEEKRGLVRWLRPDFQNRAGAAAGLQTSLASGTTKRAKSAPAAKAEKRPWPKELPAQVAAVRDLLAERGSLDLAAARGAFKGARAETVATALGSLAALGLALVAGEGEQKSWLAPGPESGR